MCFLYMYVGLEHNNKAQICGHCWATQYCACLDVVCPGGHDADGLVDQLPLLQQRVAVAKTNLDLRMVLLLDG